MFFGEDVNEISFTVKIVSAKPANTFRLIVWPMGMSLTPAETKLLDTINKGKLLVTNLIINIRCRNIFYYIGGGE